MIITIVIAILIIGGIGYMSLITPILDRIAVHRSLRDDYLRQMDKMPEGSNLYEEMARKAVEQDNLVDNAWRQDFDDAVAALERRKVLREARKDSHPDTSRMLNAARVTVMTSDLLALTSKTHAEISAHDPESEYLPILEDILKDYDPKQVHVGKVI